MQICGKHKEKILAIDPHLDELKIISEFMDEMNVIEYQERIDNRPDKCMVCFFGAIGRERIERIVVNYRVVLFEPKQLSGFESIPQWV